MAGANYMGGKRNAAKARQRDSTGRIQKRFFGRKKMDMLTKGLANRAHREDIMGKNITTNSRSGMMPGPRPIPAIQLAHARKNLAGPSAEPYRLQLPFTPKKTPRPKDSSTSGSAASHDSSPALEVLDINEPLSRRAALDKILALPDLVGISARRPQLRPLKRTANTAFVEQPSIKRKKHDDSTEERVPSPLPPSSPQWRTSMSHDFWDRIPSDHPSPTFQSPSEQDIIQHLEVNDANHDNYDSDTENRTFCFSSDPAEGSMDCPPMLVSSGKSSLQKISDSGLEPCLTAPSEVDVDVDPSHGDRSLSSCGEPQSPEALDPGSWLSAEMTDFTLDNEYEEFALDENDGHEVLSSTKIVEAPVRQPKRWKPISHWKDNLFEHSDPWHSIGVILGLSPPCPGPRQEEVAVQNLEEVEGERRSEDINTETDPEICYYDWPSEDPMGESNHPDLENYVSDHGSNAHLERDQSSEDSPELDPELDAAGLGIQRSVLAISHAVFWTEDRERIPEAEATLSDDGSGRNLDAINHQKDEYNLYTIDPTHLNQGPGADEGVKLGTVAHRQQQSPRLSPHDPADPTPPSLVAIVSTTSPSHNGTLNSCETEFLPEVVVGNHIPEVTASARPTTPVEPPPMTGTGCKNPMQDESTHQYSTSTNHVDGEFEVPCLFLEGPGSDDDDSE